MIDTYRQASYVVGLASVMMSALILEWLLDNGYSHVGQALVIISLLAAVFIGSHREGWIDWVNRWAEERGWWDEDVILKDPWALSGKCFFLSSWNGIMFLQTDRGGRHDGMALISCTISQSLLLSSIKWNRWIRASAQYRMMLHK